MIKTADLQNWGTELSKDYLESGKPMTGGLQKLATENDLNSEQVQRIAEFANLKTHLEMLKTASEDAYIKFPVADPKAVTAKILEKTAEYTDYVDRPENSWKGEKDFFKTAGVTFAEIAERPKSPVIQYKESVIKLAAIEKLSYDLVALGQKLDTALVPVYSIIKQAALGGTPVDELEYAVRAASPIGEFVIENIKEALLKDRIGISGNNLEKFAGIIPNEDNKLVEKVQDIHNILMDAMKTAEELQEKRASINPNSPLEKSAGLITGTAKGIWEGLKFMKRHPFLTIAAPSVYYVGKKAGREAQKTRHTEIWANSIDLKNKMPRE